jgi:hypothetical protein
LIEWSAGRALKFILNLPMNKKSFAEFALLFVFERASGFSGRGFLIDTSKITEFFLSLCTFHKNLRMHNIFIYVFLSSRLKDLNLIEKR